MVICILKGLQQGLRKASEGIPVILESIPSVKDIAPPALALPHSSSFYSSSSSSSSSLLLLILLLRARHRFPPNSHHL